MEYNLLAIKNNHAELENKTVVKKKEKELEAGQNERVKNFAIINNCFLA